MTSVSWMVAACTFSPMLLPLTVSGVSAQTAGRHQLAQHRRQAAGAVILLAEILAGRLHVDQQRHVVADRLPVRDRQRDADMAGDGVDVDRGVGRAADRRARDDGVLEGGAREDVGRLQVLVHDLDRAAAGRVGDLAALAVGRRESRRSPAATCRAPRPARSWSRPCPWCCNGRPRAPRTRPASMNSA